MTYVCLRVMHVSLSFSVYLSVSFYPCFRKPPFYGSHQFVTRNTFRGLHTHSSLKFSESFALFSRKLHRYMYLLSRFSLSLSVFISISIFIFIFRSLARIVLIRLNVLAKSFFEFSPGRVFS